MKLTKGQGLKVEGQGQIYSVLCEHFVLSTNQEKNVESWCYLHIMVFIDLILNLTKDHGKKVIGQSQTCSYEKKSLPINNKQMVGFWW